MLPDNACISPHSILPILSQGPHFVINPGLSILILLIVCYFHVQLSLKSDSPLSTMMVVIPQSAGCLGQLPKVSLALSARTLLYFFTVRWHVIGSTSFHKSSLHPHSLHHPGGQDIQWFLNFILFSVIELGNSRDLFHFSYKLPRTFITQTTLFLKLQILPISPLLSL